MNKSNFSVTSSYLTNPTTTRIAIQSKDGSTWLTRDVPGDHTSKTDEAKIQLILDILTTELDPAGALARYQAKSEESIKELDNRLNLAEKVAEQGELTRKIANVSILNAVMSQNIQYGTIYKQYLELLLGTSSLSKPQITKKWTEKASWYLSKLTGLSFTKISHSLISQKVASSKTMGLPLHGYSNRRRINGTETRRNLWAL